MLKTNRPIAKRLAKYKSYSKRLLAGLVGVAMVATSFLGALSYSPTADAAIPSGYVDSYWIKVHSPAYPVEVTVSHYYWDQDFLQVVHYPTDGDGVCGNDAVEVYVNGSLVDMAYGLDNSTTECDGDYIIGDPMYLQDGEIETNVMQGSISFESRGGPYGNYTTWTAGTGTSEVQLVSYDGNVDSDGDGYVDSNDNCPYGANSDQSDWDGDSIGDVCDPDDDGDGVSDDDDNCLEYYNPDQVDSDGDGYGDGCDDGACTTDDYGVEVNPYDYAYWNDGSYSYYDADCNSTWYGGASTCAWYDYYGDCVNYDAWDDHMASDGTMEQCIMYSNNNEWYCDGSSSGSSSSSSSNSDSSSSSGSSNSGSYGGYCTDSVYDSATEMWSTECYDDDGNMTSYSLWDDSYDDEMDYTEYYINGSGLFCSVTYNTNGLIDWESCWEYEPSSYGTMDNWYDRYTQNHTCYAETYDCGGGGDCWCEVCYDQNGVEQDNTCDDMSGSSSSSSSSTWGGYCEEGSVDPDTDLMCHNCYDEDGDKTSSSCSQQNYSGSYETDHTYHYMDDDLMCGEDYTADGTLVNSNCWSADDCYDCDTERHELNWTCWWVELDDSVWNEEMNYWSNWCEYCEGPSGYVVENSCGSDDNDDNDNQNDDDDDDDWEDDGGWCEYYTTMDGGMSCETCFDDQGNETYNECSDSGDVGGWCAWEEDCYRCYNADGSEESMSCDSGGGGDVVMDTTEAKRQTRELQRSLKWLENDLKEMARLEKRAERVSEDYERILENIEDVLSWWDEDGLSSKYESKVEDLQEEAEEAGDDLAELASSVGEWGEDFEDVYLDIEEIIEDIDYSELTWSDMDSYWLELRKGDKMQLVRDIFDAQVNYHEMGLGYFELKKDELEVLARLDRSDIDVPDDIDDELDEFHEWRDQYVESYEDLVVVIDDAWDVIEDEPSATVDTEDRRFYYDDELQWAREDVQWAREDLWVYNYDHGMMWDTMHQLWQMESMNASRDWMIEEAEHIKWEVSVVENAHNILRGRISDSKTLNKIEEVDEKVSDIYTMLDEIIAQAGELNSDDLEDPWNDLDKIGRFVMPRIEAVAGYVEDFYPYLNLSSGEAETISEYKSLVQYDHGCDNCDRLDDVYGVDVANAIKGYVSHDDLVTSLVTEITSSVMEAMTEYIENELAGKIMEAVVENIDRFRAEKFGDDFANRMLDNQQQVMDKITAVDFDDVDASSSSVAASLSDLENLHEDFQAVPMVDDSIAEEVADFWDNAGGVMSSGATVSEITGLLSDGTEILERADQAVYENNMRYTDVPGYFDAGYEDLWYAPHVMYCAGDIVEGYRDENGDKTYEFGVSDTTLRAEVMKMGLSTLGYQEVGSGEYWWSGWENKAENLGLSIASLDMTQPATRGEIFRMLFELARMDGAEWGNNPFSDVSSYDDWEPVVSLYNESIVTGDDYTGYARLYDYTNRAEVAALMARYDEWYDSNLDGDLLSYSEAALARADSEGWFGNFFASMGHVLGKLLPANLFR